MALRISSSSRGDAATIESLPRPGARIGYAADEAVGRNDYLLSVINPSCGVPGHIPDLDLNQRIPKSVNYNATFATDIDASGNGDFLLHWTPQSKLTALSLYVNHGTTSSPVWIYKQEITPDQVLADNFAQVRYVSADLAVRSSSVGIGATVIQGQVWGVAYQDAPYFLNATAQSLLSRRKDDVSYLENHMLADGIALTGDPTMDFKFTSPDTNALTNTGTAYDINFSTPSNGTTGTYSYSGDIFDNPLTTSGWMTGSYTGGSPVQYFFTSVIGSGGSNQALPPILRGDIDMDINFHFNDTSATIDLQVTITLQINLVDGSVCTKALATQYDHLVGISTSMRTHVSTKVPISSIRVNVGYLADGAGTPSLSLSTSSMDIHVVNYDYTLPGEISNGAFVILTGLPAGSSTTPQVITINSVINYEAVPNANLALNVHTKLPSLDFVQDIEAAKLVLSNRPHFGIRSVYRWSEYVQKMQSGYFVQVCSRETIRGMAWSLSDIWGGIKSAVKSVLPVAEAGLNGVLARSPVGQMFTPFVSYGANALNNALSADQSVLANRGGFTRSGTSGPAGPLCVTQPVSAPRLKAYAMDRGSFQSGEINSVTTSPPHHPPSPLRRSPEMDEMSVASDLTERGLEGARIISRTGTVVHSDHVLSDAPAGQRPGGQVIMEFSPTALPRSVDHDEPWAYRNLERRQHPEYDSKRRMRYLRRRWYESSLPPGFTIVWSKGFSRMYQNGYQLTLPDGKEKELRKILLSHPDFRLDNSTKSRYELLGGHIDDKSLSNTEVLALCFKYHIDVTEYAKLSTTRKHPLLRSRPVAYAMDSDFEVKSINPNDFEEKEQPLQMEDVGPETPPPVPPFPPKHAIGVTPGSAPPKPPPVPPFRYERKIAEYMEDDLNYRNYMTPDYQFVVAKDRLANRLTDSGPNEYPVVMQRFPVVFQNAPGRILHLCMTPKPFKNVPFSNPRIATAYTTFRAGANNDLVVNVSQQMTGSELSKIQITLADIAVSGHIYLTIAEDQEIEGGSVCMAAYALVAQLPDVAPISGGMLTRDEFGVSSFEEILMVAQKYSAVLAYNPNGFLLTTGSVQGLEEGLPQSSLVGNFKPFTKRIIQVKTPGDLAYITTTRAASILFTNEVNAHHQRGVKAVDVSGLTQTLQAKIEALAALRADDVYVSQGRNTLKHVKERAGDANKHITPKVQQKLENQVKAIEDRMRALEKATVPKGGTGVVKAGHIPVSGAEEKRVEAGTLVSEFVDLVDATDFISAAKKYRNKDNVQIITDPEAAKLVALLESEYLSLKDKTYLISMANKLSGAIKKIRARKLV